MHDVGMNMSQLAMSVKQVDDTIELAHEWSHQLLHATENFDMERIAPSSKLPWPHCTRRMTRSRATRKPSRLTTTPSAP